MNRHLLIVGLMLALALAPAAQAATRYEATITRTSFGMPHVKAKNFGGLGFGTAYAEAQDNICLMADAYVSAAGERSKFFGPTGDTLISLWPGKNIDSDVFFRATADIESLRSAFSRRSKDFRAVVDGWVAGYNQFLRDRKGQLPVECAGQPWVRTITRDDVLRSMNGFAMLSSSASLGTAIANAAPPGAETEKKSATPATAALEFVAPAATYGSNGWAFGGDATTNGRGLVVANPHFAWVGSNRFYQLHLTIPGKFDVAGATIVNQPYVGIGFNKDVAWTHTVDTAAHMTLFKLTLDQADPTAYVFDGKREAMTRRQITIENKDGAPIVRTVYGSRHGLIVSIPNTPYGWTHETAYAVADANAGNLRAGETWLGLGRSRSVRDIRETLARYVGLPWVNTMAADRNGDALYADITSAPNVSAERFAACGTTSGRMPALLQRLYVLDGARSACMWENTRGAPAPGLLPADKMATLYRRDYVQNSNDSYRWTNPASPFPELGPMVGRDPGDLPDLRTRSALQEIARVLQTRKFDVDLAAQTMLGNRNFAAQLALPAVLEVCKRPDAPAEACAALAKWDGQMDVDRRGAMFFTLLWAKVNARKDLWAVPFDPHDLVNTPRSLAIDVQAGDALLGDLKAAVEQFTKLDLAVDAPLGQVQFAERGAERIPISGGPNGGVLNNVGFRPVKGGFSIFHGTSYFQSVTFDDKGPVAQGVLTFSQSTDPSSPHYADQTHEFSKKKLHRLPFTDAEIAADTIAPPMTVHN